MREQGDLPVYPYSVDVPAKPARRFLFGIYFLSRAFFAMTLASAAFLLVALFVAPNARVTPWVIEWDPKNETFVNPRIGEEIGSVRVWWNDYLERYFVRKYIETAFTIPEHLADLDDAWCDAPGQRPAGDGIWAGGRCLLSMAMHQQAFGPMAASIRTASMNLARLGTTRRVEIISSELAYQPIISMAELSIFDKIMPIGNVPQSTRWAEYRVEFVLHPSDGSPSSIAAFIAVMSTPGRPDFRIVLNSFMWGRE